MSFLSQKVPIFDIWIYQYYGFRLRKEETGGDSFLFWIELDIIHIISPSGTWRWNDVVLMKYHTMKLHKSKV